MLLIHSDASIHVTADIVSGISFKEGYVVPGLLIILKENDKRNEIIAVLQDLS